MQIIGSLPVPSSAPDLGSAGLQTELRKPTPVPGEPPQTENAVKPAGESEAASGETGGDAHRQGRGRLVDVKV